MVDDYLVDRKLRRQQETFYKLVYSQGGKCVEECALLQRNIRNLFSYLSNSGLQEYQTIDRFYHKITTESIGTFVVVRVFNETAFQSKLYIKSWDWRVNPHVFPTLYPLILTQQPIYDKVGSVKNGFTVVKDARGLYNYVNKKKKLLSYEWFKQALPFNNEYGCVYAYIRMMNGEPRKITVDGLTHPIDDNYERQNAEALLNESKIRQIIQSCIDSLLLNEHRIKRQRRKKMLDETISRSLHKSLKNHLSHPPKRTKKWAT